MAKKNKGVERKTKQKRLIPAWIWMVMGSIMTLMIGAFLYLWQPFKSLDDKPEPKHGLQTTNKVDTKKIEQTLDSNSEQTTNKKEKTEPSKSDTKDNAKKQTSENEKDYEFYEILPEQEVTPIPDEVIVLEPETTKKKKEKADVTIKTKKEQHQFETYDGGEVIEEPNASTDKEVEDKTETTDKKKSDDTKNEDPIDQILADNGTNYILQINSFGSAEEADKRRAEVLLAGIDAKVVKTPIGDDNQYLYQVISNVFNNKEQVFDAQERLKSSGIDSLVVERKMK